MPAAKKTEDQSKTEKEKWKKKWKNVNWGIFLSSEKEEEGENVSQVVG